MLFNTGLYTLLLVVCLPQTPEAAPKRKLPSKWQKQLENLEGDVTKIINYGLKGEGKHVAYDKLAKLTDTNGHRLSGSESLEDAIDYLMNEIDSEGISVSAESVKVPHWVRGEESAALVEPRAVSLSILGLGTSVGTPPGGIATEAIVVKSFDELESNAEQAEGKIVVFNQPWKGYFDTYKYRAESATRAAEVGAVAVLVRSLTDFSIYTPHTGVQRYGENVTTTIPAACITVEDAEFLQRLYDKGENIIINLTMAAENLERADSRNVVAEIRGSTLPDEVVIFGGHIDSWDVGVGAMDDGGGLVISWQALSIIKELGLKPKRTMRAVFWTAEEIDASGAEAFYKEHKDEKVSAVMESDSGTFSPYGIGFEGSGLATAILEELLTQMEPINATTVSDNMVGTVDVRLWKEAGFPTIALNTADDDYFMFHHTEGDTMTVIDPDELDRCAILWTAVAYAIANLDEMLPREGAYPLGSTASNIIRDQRVTYSIMAYCVAMLFLRLKPLL